MKEQLKTVFISYSWKDSDLAARVCEEISKLKRFAVWIDRQAVAPGTRISEAIMQSMKGSDYYVLLLSENSSRSEWVKREISLAFDLSMEKQLTLVPMLLDSVEVPLEFRGLLYIDARTSFDAGLTKLVDFFVSQNRLTREFDKPRGRGVAPSCEGALGRLPLGDLRFLLTKRLTLENVKVLWFDVFNARMEDEVSTQSVAQGSVELIDRSRREDLIPSLITTICRNHPQLPRFIRTG